VDLSHARQSPAMEINALSFVRQRANETRERPPESIAFESKTANRYEREREREGGKDIARFGSDFIRHARSPRSRNGSVRDVLQARCCARSSIIRHLSLPLPRKRLLTCHAVSNLHQCQFFAKNSANFRIKRVYDIGTGRFLFLPLSSFLSLKFLFLYFCIL